jgi:hypothetical protein
MRTDAPINGPMMERRAMQTRFRLLPLAVLAGVVSFAMAMTGLRAVAQNAPATTPEKSQAPSKPAGAPKQPQPDDTDSAQSIEDDPTVAPDPEESADNNITFPVDI